MKKLSIILLFLGCGLAVDAQSFKFPVDTLIKTGPLKRRVNVVILPDGYTSEEMSKFKTDTDAFISYLLKTSPFDKYKSYFSFFSIKVPSVDSGVTHPGTAADEGPNPTQPIETKNTYFGSTFDSGNIHRLVTLSKFNNLTNVLATNFPTYDIVFVICNTPYYGGAGGFYASFTTNASANEIGLHELGHSFVNLADEYYPGGSRETLNMSKDKNPSTNRWRNWLGTPNIGIFDHKAPGQDVAKPANGTCRMEFLGKPFCSVCREGFVEKILLLISPLESQNPISKDILLKSELTTFSLNLLKPEPNSLSVEWFLDGKSIGEREEIKLNANSLPNTTAKLVAAIYDSTYFSRNNSRKLKPQVVEWVLTRGNIQPFQINANKTTICMGDSVVLTSNGCDGKITWSNSSSAKTITVKPTENTSYTANCDLAGQSNTVNITITPNPVISVSNKGPYFENETIELLGTGTGTYLWKGPLNFSSNEQNPNIGNAKFENAGIYSLTVSKDNCQTTNTTTVVINPFAIKNIEVTPQNICVSGSIIVNFSYDRKPNLDTKYTLQLSDTQGNNFNSLATTIEGTSLKATIPMGIKAGNGYKIKVVSTNPSSEFISPTVFSIKAPTTAEFENKDASIQQYTEALVKFNLTGDVPIKLKLSDNQSFDFNELNPTIKVTPNESTEYKISSVSNICGDGVASLVALKITVIPVLANEPLSENLQIYPNPSAEQITVRLSNANITNQKLELIDNKGVTVFKKNIENHEETIDLHGIASGVYHVRIIDGKQILYKKLVKIGRE